MSFISNTFTLNYPKGRNRIDIYDSIRGFAMMLVLLHHCGVPGKEYILAFHMPFFFFLSGMVSGNKGLPSFGVYLKTRFKRLMIPYLVFGIIDLILFKVLHLVLHRPYDFKMALFGSLTGQYGYVEMAFTGIWWFLYVMFIADLLIYPISKYLKNSIISKVGGVFLFLTLSYCTTKYLKLTIFTLDKSFLAAAFILLGDLFKPSVKLITNSVVQWFDIVIVTFGGLCLWLAVEKNSDIVLMYINQYGDYGWFLLGAIAGTVVSLFVAKYLYLLIRGTNNLPKRIILWTGFNSLVFFPIHVQIVMVLGPVLIYLGVNDAYRWLLSFVIKLSLSNTICNFINSYLPWMLGQTKKIK